MFGRNKDDDIPIAIQVSDTDEIKSRKEFMHEQYSPEGYYEYKNLLIQPAAAQKKLDDVKAEITRDFQLGNLSKEEYQKAQFVFGLVALCFRWKDTTKAGLHFLKELELMFIASNSKEGFLRKYEQAPPKETIIKKAKPFRDRVRTW